MKDFLTEIELAGLISRLKRLSDELLYSTRDYYKTVGLDIEPNWHLVFLLLEKTNALTISEISQELRMSHPACIKIIKKMKKHDYLISKTDKNDSRKRILELSDKAKKRLPSFHRHWEAGIQTTQELLQNSPHIFEDLKAFEKEVSEVSYKERTLKNLRKE
ncbi:MarR family transcriptional regulator [uncultured Kriegella sp.]|uniref:MarR family transcriptional regulator n=1 Tax=uncultured Kriegella sp. TaxID=1798910 RepID=UPI0030D90EBA|tara:strand:+ start:165864 stop:166346 length:483 start_codon:yes stop_codon:yes gene_type:complete